jgi:hypothetical protein
MNSDDSRCQAPELTKNSSLKMIVTLSILVGCWILWFVFARSWIVAILLSIIACVCGEFLGINIFSENRRINRLSVEHSGFSIWRVLLGVLIVLLIFSAIMGAGLVFSRVFR